MAATPTLARRTGRDRAASAAITVLALAAWAILVFLGRRRVLALEESGARINFEDAAPFIGHLDWHPSARLWVPIVVAGLTVVGASQVTRALRWRALLVVSTAWSALWSVAVALVDRDGWHGITRPLLSSTEQYLGVVHDISSLGDFVSTLSDQAASYPVHVSSHPPGMVIVHWFMDRIGLAGAGWGAALYIGVAASAVAAVLVAVRDIAGEDRARRLAPFLAVVPTAIWIASTADAFFAGVAAWGVVTLVVATGAPRPWSDQLAFVGGLLFGAVAFLSYGVPLIVLIPVAVAWVRRTLRPLVVAASAVLTVAVGFALAGFWWFDGLDATRELYHAGVGGERPYGSFLLVNASIFAAALGPAIAVALVRLRDRRLWLLAGSALAIVAIAALSGYSRGEVERIWLPFAPWVLVACVALATSERSARLWIGVQGTYTILLTTWLVSTW